MASVLVGVLDLLEAYVDGVVRDLYTEFLQDLRIAARLTRSGLALADDAQRRPFLQSRFVAATRSRAVNDLDKVTRAPCWRALSITKRKV